MKTLFLATIITVLNSSAFARVNCNLVEAIGNGASHRIEGDISRQIQGTTFRISRRKTLKIHGLRDISFNQCTLRAKIDVTLKRKIRRDAHGYAAIKARVYRLDREHVCLTSAKITSIKLSRTLRIGEAVYRKVANKVIPNGKCFPL